MRRTLSHKKLAILLSIIAAIISGTFLSIPWVMKISGSFFYLLFVLLSAFIIMYIISYYAIKKYIILKVKPIYKTIHETQVNPIRKAGVDTGDNINILAKTELEVREWAKKKAHEIEELKKLEKYRKEYIGNVSHELKTPIFSIQGYILTLLDGGLEDPSINRKYMERADKAINRMISIVKDLESISRLESGDLVLNYTVFDIRTLFLEIFDSQELITEEKNIQLKLHNAESPVLVNADRKCISQVITNLVVNSIKYGKNDGFTRASFYDMDKFILIEIKDNGIGIAEEHLSRIFERFYRVDKSRSREQGGTGLGLSIVKHIIEAHKQSINVKSKSGEGTSFTFTLEKGFE